MKTRIALVIAAFALTACHKKPDNPPPPAATISTVTPPPPSTCQNGTVPWSLPAGNTIASNSSAAFTIPGFDLGCGDSVTVYLRKDNTQSWFQLGNVNQGASYYSLTNNVVTVFNMTGITQEVDIEAILK